MYGFHRFFSFEKRENLENQYFLSKARSIVSDHFPFGRGLFTTKHTKKHEILVLLQVLRDLFIGHNYFANFSLSTGMTWKRSPTIP
jgi:hypothetical protein